MIELNVVNFITIGLIAVIFLAVVRWLMQFVGRKNGAAAA